MSDQAEKIFDADFLLQDGRAKDLFASCKDLPVIDYHGHLPVDVLAANRSFGNLAKIWIDGDHYKWRAMRLNGVPEDYCSGHAPDLEKFLKWAETIPYTLRNPLYHWTHMELQAFFGVRQELNPESAGAIWNLCNARLAEPSHTPLGLLALSKVEVLCTTDDPSDSLVHHEQVAGKSKAKIFPTFRPDKALAADDPAKFQAWLKGLCQVSGKDISSLESLLAALRERHEEFHQRGCRMSDHGLEQCYASPCPQAEASTIFQKLMKGETPDAADIEKWRSFLMLEFGKWNYEKSWTMQLHLGAIRNNNTRMFAAIGTDTGCDSVGDFSHAGRTNAFLDLLDQRGHLPKVILFNSNPRDNLLFATITGNFFQDGVRGKVQYGPAWWFLDTYDGMKSQLDALSQVGLLHNFVGMVTDSRSFLSFTRHDYFRRLVCQMLSDDMACGRIPKNMARAETMLRAICYDNPRALFSESVAC